MVPFPDILQKFDAISLDELNAVSLLQRVDTKFIFSAKKLPLILAELTDDKYILQINGRRNFEYLTHYYDTKDFKFYLHHHNGYISRMKVRTRTYVDTGTNFFEVKHKERGTQTNKIRKEIDMLPYPSHNGLSDDEYVMIENERYNGEELEMKISNSFQRITLCDKAFTERITIDTNIVFFNEHKKHILPNLCIVELKQTKADHYSKTNLALKKHQILPASFSKYAIGIVLLEDAIKKNNFKPTLLKLNKITNERHHISNRTRAEG